jgi:hypothetical protein
LLAFIERNKQNITSNDSEVEGEMIMAHSVVRFIALFFPVPYPLYPVPYLHPFLRRLS